MSQFLFVPVVENARSLACSAMPDSPIVPDARPLAPSGADRGPRGSVTARRFSLLSGRTKQAASYGTSPAL